MRLLFSFLLAIGLGVATVVQAEGPLVFLEVYPDDDSFNRRTEYLQILNRGDASVELAGWALTTKAAAQAAGSLVRLPDVGHLRPGQSFLIAFDEDRLREAHPDLRIDAHLSSGGVTHFLRQYQHASWGTGTVLELPPAEKRLLLIAPDGSVSDGVRWGGEAVAHTVLLPQRSASTQSWRRDIVEAMPRPVGAWVAALKTPGLAPTWLCEAAVCGNGHLEAGETCDDGNTLAGDGCSASCSVEAGATCTHADLPCGATARPSQCYISEQACAQPLRLQAVHLSTDDGVGYHCQDWLEFQNLAAAPFPLGALRLTESIQVSAMMSTGWDAFSPDQWLQPSERALVLDRLAPPTSLQARYTTEHCAVSPTTGFEAHFGVPLGRWFARWAGSAAEASARWDDYVDRHNVFLNATYEQLSAYCADNFEVYDAFAFAKEGEVEGASPRGWNGPRARWYPELLRYQVQRDLVFRRYPESQDTNTKADWHLSRCPNPGKGTSGLEAPIAAASFQKQLAADGHDVRVVFSEEARQRADGQIWMVPPTDSRVEVLAEEGSVFFRGVNTPEIFDFEWFAVTPCWVSEKYRATVRFGDAVRCFPDRDGDGFGDASSAGVVVGGSCGAGFVTNADDCDDSDALVNPDARELCDGIDNDCNALTSDGSAEPWFQEACDGTDDDLCADGQRLCIFGHPYCLESGPSKLDYCDGQDNDCNPATPDGAHDPRVGHVCDGADPDLCLDGVTVCTTGAIRCEEHTPPGRVELCDGLDNDCNSGTPDGYDEREFGQRCVVGQGACQRTGHYLCQPPQMVCSVTPGLPALDDLSCDGIDNDCNGLVDDGVPLTPVHCGVGACASVGVERCEDGRFLAECTPRVPGVESFESGNCQDGIDNDCDGLTDADDPECQPLRLCYYDADGDGRAGTAVELREPNCDGEWQGHALWELNEDCNDNPKDSCAALAWNGARELCDGCDNDCNGLIDEVFPTHGQRCDNEDDRCVERRWECADDGESLRCGAASVPEGAAYEESEQAGACDDGIDNDCNGLVDYADPMCPVSTGGGRLIHCNSSGSTKGGWFLLLFASLIAMRATKRRRNSNAA